MKPVGRRHHEDASARSRPIVVPPGRCVHGSAPFASARGGIVAGVLLALAGAASGAAAQPAARAVPDVVVRASLDRTAVWVADRVVYTIELTCRPGVDVLEDDVSRDKLKLDGLQILGADSTQNAAADGSVVHRYAFTLASYRVDQPELRVAPLAVRYYVKRAGLRLQDAAPSGEVQVPGTTIAFRSTLPDQQETAALRDRREAAPRARRFALAQPVGLGLVIAAFAPTLLWAAAFVNERRKRVVHRSIRQVRAEERASLESARSLDVEQQEGRREAYTRINAVVREHLREVCGVAGPSLAPLEVAPALASKGTRLPVETISSLLAECERARYGPPDALPSADACRDAIAQAEQVLAIR